MRAELSNDGVHRNRDGYARMRPLAEKAIEQALQAGEVDLQGSSVRLRWVGRIGCIRPITPLACVTTAARRPHSELPSDVAILPTIARQPVRPRQLQPMSRGRANHSFV
jgi:hypothetical protein